ncbi:alpha/beta fold hydrolase [Acidaminobacter sp. JC074]|uniref:alpha/beta fold hydrolase n=1 Tax=Acidaminobacter sp. JC074 TaxID=2530199 RepID=UPI001F10D261|nr:alpha/beta hydrolase [Acidaminobacter sp. JC074]
MLSKGMYQAIGDVDMYYEEIGSGHPIVFIHGIGFDHHYFDVFFAEFSQDYRLIFVNLRGNGLTNRGKVDRLTLAQHAKDIFSLCQSLGLKKYTLFGHSYGAFVALKHIIDFPQGLASAVLLSGSPSSDFIDQNINNILPNIHSEDLRNEVIETIESLRMGALSALDYNKVVRYGVFSHLSLFFSDYKSDAVMRVNALLEDTVYIQEAMEEFLDDLGEFDYRDKLEKITVPLLIMTGQDDVLCSASDAKYMCERIKSAQLKILNRAGHFGFVEAPTQHNEALKEFLKEI